jgi:O-antigen/teichoic acid export membrane protein
MKGDRRIALGTMVAVSGTFVHKALNLVLVPLQFYYLEKEPLGVWYLMNNSVALLYLFNFGLSPTLQRRVAFAKGLSGDDPYCPLSASSIQGVADLLATSRRMLLCLAVMILVGSVLAGGWFFRTLKLSPGAMDTTYIAWILMCVGYSINTWAGFVNSLLCGLGDVGLAGVINLGCLILVDILSLVVVAAGGGIVGLAVAWCLGGIVSRWAAWVVVRRRYPEVTSTCGKWSWELARSMAAPAVKVWLMGLGTFLVMQTDRFYIAYLVGLDAVPAYVAAYALVSTIHELCKAPIEPSAPLVSQAWQAGNLHVVRRLLWRNLRVVVVGFGTAAALLIACGSDIIRLWLGPGNFVGQTVLALFVLMLLLDCQHAVTVSVGVATEDIPYGFWLLMAAAINLVLSYVLGVAWGLVGIAAATLIAHLVTVNWYAVYRPLQRLGISVGVYARQFLLPAAVLILLTIVILIGISRAFPWSPLWRVCVCSSLAALCGLLTEWLWCLDEQDRQNIRNLAVPLWRYLRPGTVSQADVVADSGRR